MIPMKYKLLALSALSMASVNSANAAVVVYPAATLHGNGASSIANVLVQELNCFGGPNNKLAIVAFASPQSKTTVDTPEANYTPKTATAANPSFSCAASGGRSIQTNVNGEYVSTGSGDGRYDWANLTESHTQVSGSNPFEDGSARADGSSEAAWGNIHYAFSDAGIAQSDLDTYNTTAKPTAGAAIQIPLYVLPVAVAYAPSYGTLNDGSTAGGVKLAFNLKFPRKVGTGTVGGLRISRTLLCGIFNGSITNFNDPAFKTANGNQSLMDPKDNASRWSSTGVPIYLVGRKESSGTTSIFTRALAAQCSGGSYTTGTSTLPSAVQGTAVYNEASGTLASGSETSGKFGLVPNSDGVANVVGLVPAQPSTVGDVALNGHLGYDGADYVLPSTISNTPLYSADIQLGTTGTKYVGPTAANATLAFKSVLPPESASTGKYAPKSGCSSTGSGCRANPLSWVATSAPTEALANPTTGYPIVGTSNALLYTCYKSTAVRSALEGFLALHLGKFGGVASSDGAKFPAALVSSVAPDAGGLPTGIDAKNGIAPLSASFVQAIFETFLTKTTTGSNPSSLNLWIQDKLPTTTAAIAATKSNVSCSANTGA